MQTLLFVWAVAVVGLRNADGLAAGVWDAAEASNEEEARPQAMCNVCVEVRTYAKQRRVIDALLIAIVTQYATPHVTLETILVNTEDDGDYSRHLSQIATKYSQHSTPVSVLSPSESKLKPIRFRVRDYGYGKTEWALQVLLASKAHNCTHFLFTNGDNYYIPSMLQTVAPDLLAGYGIVAFDFITHHPRSNIPSSNLISVQLRRGEIDLGSAIVKREAIIAANASFLPRGNRTDGMFTRDFFFLQHINLHGADVKLVRTVLFSHQRRRN